MKRRSAAVPAALSPNASGTLALRAKPNATI
jgi:hypothetical protein